MTKEEMMEFLNNYEVDFEKIKERVKENPSGYKRTKWLSLKNVGDKATIRILPAQQNKELPFYKYWSHWIGKRGYKCVGLKNGCLACRARIYLDTTGKEEAKWVSGSANYLYNILDRADNEVKVLRLSNTLHKEMYEDSTEDFTNPRTGRDFIYKKPTAKKHSLKEGAICPVIADSKGKLDVEAFTNIYNSMYDLEKASGSVDVEKLREAINGMVSLNNLFRWEKANGKQYGDQILVSNKVSVEEEKTNEPEDPGDFSDLGDLDGLDIDSFDPEDMPF